MGTIMLAMGLFTDWEAYMPDLIRRAIAAQSRVHVLEFAAPLGTGLLTSNKPPDDESYPQASSATVLPTDQRHFDASVMPHDTAEAALETTAFLNAVEGFLHLAGLTVTTAWLPMLDHRHLGAYARSQSADTVALIRRGWWATLLTGDDRPGLLRSGLQVIYLERTDGVDAHKRVKPDGIPVGGELSGS